MKNLILIGGGGHCKSVIDTIQENKDYNIIGILDLAEKVGENILGVEIIGTDDTLDQYFKNGVEYAFITMGSVGDIKLRKNLYNMALEVGFQLPNIIDKTAIVSEYAKIGQGNFIGKGAIINAEASIGNNCIINTGAVVEHDCIVGDFCHIAPSATLSGSVNVGNNTHIGANAAVIQNIKIGKNVIVGAGSVVIKAVKDGETVVGVPAKSIKGCK